MRNRKIEMPESVYNEKVAERVRLQEMIEKLTADMQAARALGDLSENAEYASAKAGLASANVKLALLNDELANAIKVKASDGPKIGIGDRVKVTRVDAGRNPLEEPRVFTIAAAGDTVMKKILSTKSSLGKNILGCVSGYYTIPDNGGISYHVEKIRE